MYIVGLDIGYSKLKIVHGEPGRQPAFVSMPTGAAPLASQRRAVGGAGEGVRVLVEQEPYIAGLPARAYTNWVRSLSADYPFTDQYLALYHAALLRVGRLAIDRLVTGLPVEHYQQPGVVQRLRDRLRGTHLVTEERTVQVRDVLVLPLERLADLAAADATELPLVEVRNRLRTVADAIDTMSRSAAGGLRAGDLP